MMSELVTKPSGHCDRCESYNNTCTGCARTDIVLCEFLIKEQQAKLHSTESRRKKEGCKRKIKSYRSTIKRHKEFVERHIIPEFQHHIKFIFDEYAEDKSLIYKNGAADALFAVARTYIGSGDFLYDEEDVYSLDFSIDLKTLIKSTFDEYASDVSLGYKNGAADALAAFASRMFFGDEYLYPSDIKKESINKINKYLLPNVDYNNENEVRCLNFGTYIDNRIELRCPLATENENNHSIYLQNEKIVCTSKACEFEEIPVISESYKQKIYMVHDKKNVILSMDASEYEKVSESK